MRLSVTYKVERIPIDYRLVVLSLLKEALCLSDERYCNKLYEENAGSMKPFSTAVYLKDFSYLEHEIQLSSLTITISSFDMEFMLHIFNGLQRLNTYKTAGETWRRISIQMLKEAQIQGRQVYFSTLSPILIEDKLGKPVHPDDPSYVTEFGYYAALRIQELTGREPHEAIKIEPLAMKKTVIRESNSVFRQRSDSENKYLYFTAYRGQLKLSGHPEDLQLLYQSGVGKRASQSFGLLEYIREE
ncbi:CRISPR-associated endoribonuclease Cas6 [Paenibacillus macerans]|uniref:CRISPR-associated endoribonuclease Cas6 n=1 Tax=Paenibacillus macerans TaxID=44252 RepID=UPI0022E36B1A|nr:CRISPR-associated endoribonuclease Cas6 [Paenibacillus macerans]MEC0138303.1 CRISPR-associated endoribonuclease Cas6 [Paenibacillus macerans]